MKESIMHAIENNDEKRVKKALKAFTYCFETSYRRFMEDYDILNNFSKDELRDANQLCNMTNELIKIALEDKRRVK